MAGGRDGMDCSGRIWMTFTKIDVAGAYSLSGTFGGVSGEEKIYLRSRIIMKIYPTLSLVIGGRDGMDGGG